MKTNLPQSEKISAKAAAITANSTLQDNLRSLRLSYLLENAVQAAEHAAGNGTGHLQYLQELIAGEVALRHDRSVQRRIHDARFPVLKTMAGWDWNWPAKINRMQVEHLLELHFIDTWHQRYLRRSHWRRKKPSGHRARLRSLSARP
jgi:DNA replication protein DnaC